MCGIVGAFGAAATRHREAVQTGLRVLRHRGPEATGLYAHPSCLLGHNRLKIIDLSDGGNQPFEDNRFVLVFNGEIYNYLELKSQFGYPAQTASDTEILFAHLKRFRENLREGLSYLNGMFALAFFDKVDRRLILVRDRLGVKPLLYAVEGDCLFFASEVKGLFPLVLRLPINHRAVVNFLVDKVLDYAGETFFETVRALPSASYAEVSLGATGVDLKLGTLWEPEAFVPQGIDETEAVTRFQELFESAVDLRLLRTDVPVAILLSGGLDSGAIASVAARRHPEVELTCVSAVYPDDSKDERRYAEALVACYPNLRPQWIEMRQAGFVEAIEAVVRAQETPIADGSMVAHYLLMRRIHELGIKVVLSGQGGDEILGGYDHTFGPARQADNLRSRQLVLAAPRAWFHACPAGFKNGVRRLVTVARCERFFRDRDVLDWVDPLYKDYPGQGVLGSYLLCSLRHWTLPGFLHYEDRNSMAFSIEARGPFLDYRLVEFLLSLPGDFKIRGGRSKWILREALSGVLPEAVRCRKNKQAFYAPIERWADSLPGGFREDRDFADEFPYLDRSEVGGNWTMKWRVYTLWVWFTQVQAMTEGSSVFTQHTCAPSI